MKVKKDTEKLEFSKKLLLQESLLIWIITIAFIILAFVCVCNQYFGELPWLAAMCGFPWTAYGASQTFYFKKAEKENTSSAMYLLSILNKAVLFYKAYSILRSEFFAVVTS